MLWRRLGASSATSAEIEGVGVGSVERSTPAQRAGIRAGDIITSFDGEKVKTTTDLKNLMNRRRPGDTVTLGIVREGKSLEIKVALEGK